MPGHDRDDPATYRAAPGEWSRTVQLRDGTPMLLRPLRAEDRWRLVEGLKRLSPASRYLRFHADIDELSDEQLTYLTDIDHVDHEAIVGLDLDRRDRPGVGVARYIREPYEPTVAEAAITVADEYHGLGAGTVLLGALANRARSNGVEVFRSYVLASNTGMLEVFDHLGAHRELESSGLWRVDLPVPEDEADVPRSAAGRAFLQAARDERRLASLFPPIWSRLRRPRRDPGHGGGQAPADTPSVRRGPGDGDELAQAITEELSELRDELDGWFGSRDER